MKRLAVVGTALAVVATVASGCTSNHPPTGTVAGTYRLTGGPSPGVNRAEPGTVWAYAGRVTLSQMLTIQAVAHVNTNAAGRYALTLRPGQYTLLGAQGLSHSVKADGCGAPVVVRVRASTRTSVDLVCSVP